MIESEKKLEKLLNSEVGKIGGWSIKLIPFQISGLPDRMCLIPGGKVFFVELKTTGKKPTLLQKNIHKRFRDLGFEVFVLDSSKQIKNTVKRISSC